MVEAQSAKSAESSKILLVEDDPEILNAVVELLKEEGYALLIAKNGEEALALIQKSEPSEIALILLDLMLPVMSGHEFLTRIKSDPLHPRARIPIVITSAAGPAAEQVATLVNGYVKKPMHLEQLLRVISKYVPKAP